ncbi:MAG: hypothetical protein D6798_02370 [Deltaproteobacteria bacterium]|nr:MAG: hypothetical protein D6798_02370 [Deltaproteobacteria bacterium]
MIFGESGAKDLYRKVVWGPLRQGLEAAPVLWEVRGVRAMGRAAGLAMGGKVRHVRDNLHRGLGDRDDLDRLARDTFATHFGNQYIGFLFGKCTADTWPRYLELRGLEHLRAAAALGRGVVLTHPHMGPAQLPLHVLGLLGWPMHQVGGGRVVAVELSETGRWAAATRAALEDRIQATLHDGGRFLRPVLRALQAGEVVMTACDGTGGGEELGRRVVQPVLGQPMGIPRGPVWMAWKSGAPLLTVRTFRNRGPAGPRTDGGQGRAWFVAEIGPPLEFQRDGGKEEVFASGTAAIAAYLTDSLARYPGDWHFWDSFEPGGLLVADHPTDGGEDR